MDKIKKFVILSLFLSCNTFLFGLSPYKDYVAPPYELGYKFSEFNIPINDSEFVNVWYIPANKASKRFFIVAGGDADNKSYLIRYINFLHSLFNILVFDYRGFGKSKGVVKTENDLIEDFVSVIKWVKAAFPDNEIYIGGYALGGAVSLTILKRRKDLGGVY